jgi:hypothetical protein
MALEDGLWILVGAVTALATIHGLRLVRLDRERATYPLLLIFVAGIYVAFAVGARAPLAAGIEVALALPFVALAVLGHLRNRLWLVAGWLGHAVLDLAHHRLVADPGVPEPYPWLCLGFDVVIAARLLWPRRGA